MDHANGISGFIICNLQNNVWTVLIHALQKWLGRIKVNLWLYALHQTNESHNYTPLPSGKNGHSPYQMFTGTIFNYNPKHCIPFGYPTYVINK